MNMATKGHLECYFDCGVSCDSLETLALHIELDHREDNDISPFVVRDEGVDSSLPSDIPPPLPARPPPPLPSRSKVEELSLVTTDEQVNRTNGYGSDESEADLSFICDAPGCGEQVLLIELGEHSDMHEAERLTLDEISHQSTSHTAAHSSINSSHDASGHQQNFSTSIPAALRPEQHKMKPKDKDSPRQRMVRKFQGLNPFGPERSRPAKAQKDSVRLGVSLSQFTL